MSLSRLTLGVVIIEVVIMTDSFNTAELFAPSPWKRIHR